MDKNTEHFNLLLNQQKPNTIEFDVTIEGVNTSNAMEVYFAIETTEFCMEFKCEHKEGNKWVVSLPVLSQLEKETYPFIIEVIADGFYFVPVKGSLNVVGSAEVYISKPEVKLQSPLKQTNKDIEVKPVEEPVKKSVEEPVKEPEESAESIAAKIVGDAKMITENKDPKTDIKSIFKEKKKIKKEFEIKFPVSKSVNEEVDKRVKKVLNELHPIEKPPVLLKK